MSSPGAERNPVECLAEEFARRCRRGEQPSVTEYAERYPELAREIRELFPALLVMEQLKPAGHDLTSPGEADVTRIEGGTPRRLGDYRLLREVGRGGMGVVYEAVQESLGRHVALKVLPGHGLVGPTYLERFRREAKAAARLHHTNIVPVFGTGVCDGVHFYAMQFIPGQGLDRVLQDLRRLRAGQPGDVTGSAAHRLCSGEFTRPGPAQPEPPTLPAETAPVTRVPDDVSATHSGLNATSRGIYYQSVANIGVQVAEALAHAHRQGILHRDIKPSNLLLDPQGIVWVTDFGLAKADDGGELTNTGDVIGTMRYMAPERFDGVSVPQGDLYSLGLTLYELVTLQPPFDDANPARLIEKILCEPPPPPRRLDRRVPRDLETVVLKSLAKDPRERYARAEDLADDLRRFLADQPVRARRSSRRERAWRWCRRNPAVASLSMLVVLLLLALSAGSVLSAVHFHRERDTALANEQRALKAEADASHYQKKLEFHLSVLPDPGMLVGFRGKVGKTFRFRVVGATTGLVWGTDVYSDDSMLATAAVHAGVLRPGEQGVVRVTILPGRNGYTGSIRNGVHSDSYRAWLGSFRVEPLSGKGKGRPSGPAPAAPVGLPPLLEQPAGLERPVVKVVFLEVIGSTRGYVWGTDLYTEDSWPATAAVHAGILRVGQRGTVKITFLPGHDSYTASRRNGVVSHSYGPWSRSYRIEAVRP